MVGPGDGLGDELNGQGAERLKSPARRKVSEVESIWALGSEVRMRGSWLLGGSRASTER